MSRLYRPTTALAGEILDALDSTRGRKLLGEIFGATLRAANARAADNTLIDVVEAASLTKRSIQAVYRAVSRGTFPGVVRVGGRLRFLKKDLVTPERGGE